MVGHFLLGGVLKSYRLSIKSTTQLCIATLFIFLVVGCASLGSDFRTDAVSKLQRAKTTEAEAIALLGSNPYSRTQTAEGYNNLMWLYATKGASKSVSIQFDSHGVMSSFIGSSNVPLPKTRLIGISCGSRLPSGEFSSKITMITPGGSAQAEGWLPGDTIVAIDGVPVSTLRDVLIATDQGDASKLYSVRRDEKVFESRVNFDRP
jgi:hypothetical protein